MARLHLANRPVLVGETGRLVVWHVHGRTVTKDVAGWFYVLDFVGGPFLTLTNEQWEAVRVVAYGDELGPPGEDI